MATRSATVAGSRPRVRLTARAALLATVVIVLAIMAVTPVRLYLEQRHQIDRLHVQTQRLAEDNARLEKLMTQLEDPEYLERLARECLGMVRQGETAFVVVTKGEQSEPAPC